MELIFKPAQSIVSRIFCFFPPPSSNDTILQVFVSRIGTEAAVSSFAMLFTFSAVEER